MLVALQPVQLDHAVVSAGQLVVITNRLNLHAFFRRGEAIGRDRVRRLGDALEERLVRLVRQNRRAFIHRRADPAEMIPVMMRRDDVTDRLARNQLLRLGEHRLAARLRERRVDDRDVITHVDGQAVMRRAGQVIHAVGHLLRLDANRRRLEVADVLRHVDVHRGVRGHR